MRSFQIGDAETIGAMVSDGRITTDILCRALPQSWIRDICLGAETSHLAGSYRWGRLGQAQDACDRFLAETARVSFGSGRGKAASALAGGSFGFGCGRGSRTVASAVGGCSGCCEVHPSHTSVRRMPSWISGGTCLTSLPLAPMTKVTSGP
jgi:hypothetical protein